MGVNKVRIFAGLGSLGLVLLAQSAVAQPCPKGNLLEGRAPLTVQDIEAPLRLTDGWATVDQMPYDHPDAAKWRGPGGAVTWDLGAAYPLSALELQADGNDRYLVSGSVDGNRFETVWTKEPAAVPGLSTTSRVDAGAFAARYVRLQATAGDGIYSATELRAFCDKEAFRQQPLHVRQNVPLPSNVKRQVSGNSGQLVVLLLGSLLAFGAFAPAIIRRFRVLFSLLIIAAAALGWTHFLAFNGKSDLHVGDAFHYFMGPKYFRNTGYFDLYRCVARAERELGHGEEYATAVVRDSDDNRVWHGSWFATDAGRCRAEFTPAKWDAFKRDVTAFRWLIRDQGSIARLLVDHGFNATPFHATYLRALVLHLDASELTLRLLAQMDTLSMLGAIAALWWGFGPMKAALFAVLLGTGAFWGYPWLGGTIGRHVWVFWMALGLSAARRKRPALATVALTMAGLHRLYPLFFLGAYLAWHGARALRQRRWTAALKTSLVALAVTLSFALVATTVSVGPRSFLDYTHVISRHAGTPGGNRLGFPLLLSTHPGGFASNLMDSRLTDPSEVWVQQVRDLSHAHWPLRVFVSLLSLLLIGRVAMMGSPWVTILAAGPLLFALQDITSYDFIWITFYGVIAIERVRWRWWLVGFVALSIVLWLVLPDMEQQHFVGNWALLLLLSVIGIDLWQRPGRAIPPVNSRRTIPVEPR